MHSPNILISVKLDSVRFVKADCETKRYAYALDYWITCERLKVKSHIERFIY